MISASPAVYREALTSTLAELNEDDEFEFFVSRIPSFLNSHVVSDVSTVLDLMNPSGGGDSTLPLRLHHFFKTSLPKASSLGPDDRKRRMHVSLAAIWSYAKVYSMPNPRERDIPEHFRTLFADPSDVDSLLTDEDMPPRVMVLCINSLLAIKIVEDVRYRTGNSLISDELAFLEKVLGPFWRPDVHVDSCGPIELANLMAMLAGLDKAIHQEASFLENLGQEVSESLATSVGDSLF